MSDQSSGKSHDEAVRKLAEMLHGIRIAMLTTKDEQGNLHSRPMATQQADFDGSLWFFTDDTAAKRFQIEKENHVNLSYAKPDEHRFVSIAGRGQIVHDKEKMKELWSPLYKTWFPQGLDTPHIALLRVEVDHAEYWDTQHSAMVHLIGVAKAMTTGERYQPGKNEKLDLTG